MNIFVVDDEYYDLLKLDKLIKTTFVGYNTFKFSNSLEALEFAKKNKIDIAFLDITIPFMNGFDLARTLKSINNDILICFVSGYDQVSVEEIHHIGYVEKPFNQADIEIIYKKICVYKNGVE